MILFNSKEQGFSLIETIVAMGILILVITYFAGGRAVQMKSLLLIESASSSTDFVEVATEFISQRVASEIASICAGNLDKLANVSLGAVEASFTNRFNFATQTETTVAVAKRCKKSGRVNRSNIYLCFKFGRDNSVSRQVFLGGDTNYMELKLKLTDRLHNLISCSDYKLADPGDAGYQAIYRLYWQGRQSKKKINRYTGYFYGIK